MFPRVHWRSVLDPTQLSVTTRRLRIEPLTPAHAEELFHALQDPRIYEWISNQPPASLVQLQNRWAEINRPHTGGTASLGWAIRRSEDSVYVGKCDAEIAANGVATNVGYLVFPRFWNQGYATEALRGMVAILARHAIVELHAFVTLGNLASERVLSHAGFVRRRIVPNNDVIRGKACDDVEYARDR